MSNKWNSMDKDTKKNILIIFVAVLILIVLLIIRWIIQSGRSRIIINKEKMSQDSRENFTSSANSSKNVKLQFQNGSHIKSHQGFKSNKSWTDSTECSSCSVEVNAAIPEQSSSNQTVNTNKPDIPEQDTVIENNETLRMMYIGKNSNDW